MEQYREQYAEFDRAVKEIEKAKDDLARFYAEHRDDDTEEKAVEQFAEYFSAIYGHKFTRNDTAVLMERFEEAVENGRYADIQPKPTHTAIKVPCEVTPYSMLLLDKAKEIKKLIDANEDNIRFPEKRGEITIEVWSNIDEQGKDYGTVRIVSGGEAMRLKYGGERCVGCDYNDHIFHQGQWENVGIRYEQDTMKTVLKDIFEQSINDADRFVPNLTSAKEMNHKQAKGEER